MRLAYFSPYRPQQSGISDYSEELLPYLARYADIDLFFDGDVPTNPELTKEFRFYPIQDFPILRQERHYDTCLYQMGNNPYHQKIYETLRAYPGITVLHEHTLHPFVWSITGDQGDTASYWRELLYHTNHLTRPFDNLRSKEPVSFASLALACRVIDLSFGVIVHNREMQRRVLADRSKANVAVVPMGMPLPPGQPVNHETQAVYRRKLNLPETAFIIMTFGHLNTAKRIGVVLQAFARLRQQYPQAIYVMVGKNSGDYDLPALIAKYGLNSEAVIVTNFVPNESLLAYIQAADVCVNLRYPVYGETSAAALRVMAYGKPIIVSDVPTFADFPEDVCLKVKVDAAEIEFLYRCLLLLAQRPDLRNLLGQNARNHIKKHHTLEHAARQVTLAVQNILETIGKSKEWFSHG